MDQTGLSASNELEGKESASHQAAVAACEGGRPGLVDAGATAEDQRPIADVDQTPAAAQPVPPTETEETTTGQESDGEQQDSDEPEETVSDDAEYLTLPAAIWGAILPAVALAARGILPSYVAAEYTEGDDRWYAHSCPERRTVVVQYYAGQRAIEAARNAMPALQSQIASLTPSATTRIPAEHPQREVLETHREKAMRELLRVKRELDQLAAVSSRENDMREVVIVLADLTGDLTIAWRPTSTSR